MEKKEIEALSKAIERTLKIGFRTEIAKNGVILVFINNNKKRSFTIHEFKIEGRDKSLYSYVDNEGVSSELYEKLKNCLYGLTIVIFKTILSKNIEKEFHGIYYSYE
jgi:hypothetical protein